MNKNKKIKRTEDSSMEPAIEASMVRVVAPATLDEGYSFEAMIDNTAFLVVVPPGGVEEGQEFEVPYPSTITGHSLKQPTFDSSSQDNDDEDEQEDVKSSWSEHEETPAITSSSSQRLLLSDDYGVVLKSWRTTVFSCCDVATQATFWMALCCLPVLYAQLLTRYGFNEKGQETTSREDRAMAYNRLVLTFLFLVFVGAWIPLAIYPVGLGAILYYWYIGVQLRQSLRRRYEIPVTSCSCFTQRRRPVVDDFCCIVCCTCCTAIQMARHSHNDKEYPGACCTTTGLEFDAPPIFVDSRKTTSIASHNKDDDVMLLAN